MPDAPFQPQLAFSPHNNQSLFSDHYLKNILRLMPEWKAWQTPAAEFLTWLRELYAKEQDQLENYNESQLEDNWIKPILTRLGHVWEGQASIPGLSKNIKKPDFALFPDEAARQTAVPQQNTPHYVKDVLALVEAKKWTVNLSKKSGPLPIFDDQNPLYQIDTYLSLSGVAWGVVSNGRFWRLVHKNSSRTLETYFEIDLLAALHAAEDSSAGLAVATFFWAFFNQGAFRADAHGTIFLDEALSQSKAYAIALEADLRDNAYRSLEQLIIGFFAGDGRLNPQNADHRDEVYRNSLYLLYRLLFLFYGEARALLPMGNNTYKNEYSLQILANDINRERDRLETLPTTGRRRWNRLTELFRLISGQDAQLNAELGVPRYNGGLFDPEQHPFLETYFVGDRALAKAIDYLAYRRVREDGRFQGYQSVDYRTLDVRQLGSIYEGLLEYKVAVATEEMVTVRQKGVETWLPARQSKAAPLDRRQPGELYLTNDKGERKATGSYYTPDYIVEYIVAHTLGPLVAQARERVKAQVRETGSLDKAERQRQSAALFVQEILALNVLDPAMGSGHFLVEATHFLARALATDEYVVPGTGAKTSSDADVTPVPGTADETDLLYWKRRVVEACIYGVDKNPMAVELAKLSLWLKTAAADKPLSFLDHHLQHGDSLIGAWLDDLHAAPGSRPQGFAKGSTPAKTTGSKPLGSEAKQPSPAKTTGSKPLGSEAQQPLFDDSAFTRDINRAVADVMRIESLPTLEIEDVHAKEATWQQIRQTHVARWQKLADLWVSAYFGNTMTPEEYRALAVHLQHFPGNAHFPGNSEFPGKSPTLLSEAQLNHFLQHPAVTDSDYFHWELAFPEVFFDEYGRSRRAAAGFDAVIGNPPYVRQEQLTLLKPFFSEHFATVYAGAADLFVYFFKQALNLLRADGLTSYISSNSWLRANFATSLRGYLRQRLTIETLIDLGDNRVFDDAPDLYPSIHFVKKAQPPAKHVANVAVFTRGEGVSEFKLQVEQKKYSVWIHDQVDEGWQLGRVDERRLFGKLQEQHSSLNEVVVNQFFWGIKTGFNQAFIIDSSIRDTLIGADPNCAEIIKPILRGADLRPWYQIERDEWLIFTRRGIDINKYPSVKTYLEQFRTNLEPCPKDWDRSKKWPGRKAGSYEWYEIQDSVDYYEVFEMPKIVWPDIAKIPRFSWDSKNQYPEATGFCMPLDSPYLLGILQSRVIWFCISNLCHHLGERAGLMRYRLKSQYMANVPIPEANPSERDQIEQLAGEITESASKRYKLHEQIRHRILTDLGTPNGTLNNALTAWWDLDFPTFRAQIKKVFKRDIPLKERHEWELFLADARQQHQQLTSQIITLETKLNQHVYTLFHLTPEEIQIIETSTKYPYGEV